MTPFMNEDFLLKSDVAKKLYHEHSEAMPIIDCHCQINPLDPRESESTLIPVTTSTAMAYTVATR